MLSFLGFLNEQKKGDTAATTFFHEVICGIACYDSRGASQIKTGEDIKKCFDDKYTKYVKNYILLPNMSKLTFFGSILGLKGPNCSKI